MTGVDRTRRDGQRSAGAWPSVPSVRRPRAVAGDPLRVAAVVGVGVYAVTLGWLAQRGHDVTGAVLLASVLLLVVIPVLVRVGRRDGTPGVVPLLVGGYVAKLVASAVRYLVAFDVYDGVADAAAYHRVGTDVAARIWSGSLSFQVGRVPGTGAIEVVTGVIYSAILPSLGGGFVAFATIAYAGQVLAWRAFRVGVPHGNGRRYAALVLLLPSLLFWPSSIGKEAWMMLALGGCALGAAHLVTGSRRAWPLLLLGLAAAYAVRPHIAMLVLVSLVVTVALRPGARHRSPPVVRFVGTIALLALTALLLVRVQSYFGVESAGLDLGASEVFDAAATQTAQGGSSFEPVGATNPLLAPVAAASVLYRPLPFEAANAQMALASLEGLVLLGLTVRYRANLVAALRSLSSRRYVLFSVVYLALFVVAFSSIENFGILVRQRTQVLPFFLVLLCVDLPVPRRPVARRGAARTAGPVAVRGRAAASPAPAVRDRVHL